MIDQKAQNKEDRNIASTDISDIYIPVKQWNDNNVGELIDKSTIEKAWFFTRGEKKKLDVNDYSEATSYVEKVIEALNGVKGGINNEKINDIQVPVESNGKKSFLRVHKEEGTSYGTTFAIRVQPEVPPDTEEMGLPFSLFELLNHRSLEKGGLIIFVAGLGAGKTTSASAVVRSRLQTFGGMGVSIEDPPEHNLMGKNYDGNWGNGKIIQKWVRTSDGESFSDAVRASLRMFPATPGNLLFLGEIRDSDTAEHALSAAANGSLVLATVHGNNAASGLDRFLSYTVSKLGKDLSYNMLRDCLRLTIFQRLTKLKDGAGVGEWGSAYPDVEMIHNLVWKGSLNSQVEAGFDPKNGIKQGMKDVVDQQRNTTEVGAKLLNTAVNAIIRKASPRDVANSLNSICNDESWTHHTFREQEFSAVCEYVGQKSLDEDTQTRLMRSNSVWQTKFEPEVFVDLRARIVSVMLERYYGGGGA